MLLKNITDKNTIKRVLAVFKKNYQPIPLEVFGSDPYKTLVSTLLSSRTKDEVTLKSSNRLFAKARNIYELANLEVVSIEKLIYPVGFYHTKAKQLKKLAKDILNKHKGEIPNNKLDLIKLSGVGVKTANLTLNRAFKIPAIAVDTHVHKISNYLGWVNTKTPEKTEKELIKIIPKKYWKDINRLFVSIGRQYKTKRKIMEFLAMNKLISH